MTCERYRGLMVLDRFYDLRGDKRECEFTGWHCLNCGEILDPVLLRNRQASVASHQAGGTQSPDRSLEKLVGADNLIEASLEHGE